MPAIVEPLRLQLMSTAVWRTRAVQQLNGAEVRYAEVSPREYLLTADGAGTRPRSPGDRPPLTPPGDTAGSAACTSPPRHAKMAPRHPGS